MREKERINIKKL